MYEISISLRKKILYVIDFLGGVVEKFPIITGRKSLEGAKGKEGDERTPRGMYYVCTVNEKSKFTLFFGISYPNKLDALWGLERGVITKEEYSSILDAIERRVRPPWDTPLGGEIGIHGGGIDRDGTRGCIGMKDEDVLMLKRYIGYGSNVYIGW